MDAVKPTWDADTAVAERPETGRASVGELVGDISADFSRLMRDEVALAKAELREEAARAGKAGTFYAIAGFAGYMTVVLLSLTAVFALGTVLSLAWAALIVTGVWAVIALIGFLVGRKRMRGFSPMPQQTVETLKEDARWLRHPTRLDATSRTPGPGWDARSTNSPTGPCPTGS